MNIVDYISEDEFKFKLLSQLSKEQYRDIEKVNVIYTHQLDHCCMFTDRESIIIQFFSGDASIYLSWDFNEKVLRNEINECLRFMRKSLRESLNKSYKI